MSPRLPPSLAMLGLVIAIAGGFTSAYDNDWGMPVLVACHNGQVIRTVHSIHDNGREDRIWKFTCGAAPSDATPTDCLWTDYVNGWNEPIDFMCPADHVIAGIQSYHDNGPEDRRYKFKCCKQDGYMTYSCYLTAYLNNWDEPLTYNVQPGKVLTGWASKHDNGKQDRQHKMAVCSYGHLIPENGFVG